MDLVIEKLIYGGDGLARLPADDHRRGKAVFVPFVLETEKVAAALIEEKAGFARARVEKIIEASPQRIEPGIDVYPDQLPDALAVTLQPAGRRCNRGRKPLAHL